MLTFCLLFLSLTETGLLTSPIITVNWCISPVSFNCFCYMLFEALLIDARTFTLDAVTLLGLSKELTLLILHNAPKQ